jgi:flagellar biosynthesis/type III secretory pathway M-ring protein FliF/YscJ
MKTVLHLLTGGDLCSLGLLILILTFVGQKMAATSPWALRWGWRIAAGAFVAFCVWGSLFYRPTDAQTLAWIACRGLFAAGLALGPAWIVLAILGFIFETMVKPAIDKAEEMAAQAEQDRKQRQRDAEEAERRRREQEEYERRQRERVPAPPPATREERAKAARERYEERLRMADHAALDDVERQAAREEAKRKYLREIDEAMR